ncbi:hydroxyethylthiazole kinase [Methanobrevibacter sp. DSM 116169]|uniref:hydroxyethylthiazole kinase n=1 Tax=Methanobrevibacter sp. DSM 116169 TaxID=3242727 RepID=UPI0038FD1375
MKSIIEKLEKSYENIEEMNPLTHCITNFVTVNDCANAVLAVGASPIMADDADEVEEIVEIADVLVINIGKLSKVQIAAIETACNYASQTNTPIVLDPVGCGISNLRNETTLKIIKDYDVTAIRGNMSEVKAIAKLLGIFNDDFVKAKGVDVSSSDVISHSNLKENASIVKEVALKSGSLVIASGPIDIISDGEVMIAIENGDEMMERITGSGCMLSSIVGSFIACNDALIGGISASLIMSIAGENAREYVNSNDLGTGTFRSKLIDNLYKLKHDEIKEKGNIYEIN